MVRASAPALIRRIVAEVKDANAAKASVAHFEIDDDAAGGGGGGGTPKRRTDGDRR